jgi:hypothetical protein
MSNFSDLLALSRRQSDNDRYAALSRAAELRAKRMQLEQADKDRAAKQDQFSKELGFNYYKEDSDAQTKRDALTMQTRESSADRQNRLDVVDRQGKTQRDLEESRSKTTLEKEKQRNSTTLQAQDLKNQGFLKVAEKKGEDGRTLEVYRHANGMELERVKQEGATQRNDANNDVKREAFDHTAHENELKRMATSLENDKKLAATAKIAAQASKDRRAIANAHLADQHVKNKERLYNDYLHAVSNPMTPPAELARIKAAVDDLESSNPVAVADMSEMVGPLISGGKSEVKPDPYQKDKFEIDSEPAPKVDLPTSDVKQVNQKLGLAQPEPVAPAPVPTTPNPFMKKPVTSLKGLLGPEREQAIAAFKAQSGQAVEAEIQKVYKRALAKGLTPEQAQDAAINAPSVQMLKEQVNNVGAPAPEDRASYKQLTPKNENSTMLRDILGMKTKDIEYTEPTGMSQAMKKASYGVLGARLPEGIPVIGGADLVPGSTKPMDTQNTLTATGMMAIPGIAEKASKYVAPVTNKIGDLLSKVPGVPTAAKAAGSVYNKASGAIDEQLAKLPALGASDTGAAMNNAAAKAVPQMFSPTTSATDEIAQMLAGRAAPPSAGSTSVPQAPQPNGLSTTIRPSPMPPPSSVTPARPTVLPSDPELVPPDLFSREVAKKEMGGMAPTPLPQNVEPPVIKPAPMSQAMSAPTPTDQPFQFFDQQLGRNIKFNSMQEFMQYLDNSVSRGAGMILPPGTPPGDLDFGKTIAGFRTPGL